MSSYGEHDYENMIDPSLEILRIGMMRLQKYVSDRSLSTINLAVFRYLLDKNIELAKHISDPFGSAYRLQEKTGELVSAITHTQLLSMEATKRLHVKLLSRMEYMNGDFAWLWISRKHWMDKVVKEYQQVLTGARQYQGEMFPSVIYHTVLSLDLSERSLYSKDGLPQVHEAHKLLTSLLNIWDVDTVNSTEYDAMQHKIIDRRMGRMIELGQLSVQDVLALNTADQNFESRLFRFSFPSITVEPQYIFREVFNNIKSSTQRGFALRFILDFLCQYDHTVRLDFNEMVEVINSDFDLNTPFSLLRLMVSVPSEISCDESDSRVQSWDKYKIHSYWHGVSIVAKQNRSAIERVYELPWRDTAR